MLTMKILPLGPLQTNCYVISDENKNCIIADCDSEHGRLTKYIEENQLQPKSILLTHGHADHIGAVNAMKTKYGCKVAIGEQETDVLENEFQNPPPYLEDTSKVEADILLKDGEKLKIGEMEFQVMMTPGHTKGSVCYMIEDMILSGDTLFAGSCGRTDFYSGSWEEITKSLKKLAALKGDYRVFPGHGPSTTLEFERKHNPFMI